MPRRVTPFVAALALLAITGCTEEGISTTNVKRRAQIATGDTVTVVKVVKGDELVVEKAGKQAEVRLVGIQAFSSVMPKKEVLTMAERTVVFLREQLQGKQVVIHIGTPKTDVYGRYLARVEHDGVDINKLLVKRGLAIVYTEFSFPQETDYLAVEAGARDASTEIWAQPALVKLATGLRKQWAQARSRTDGKPYADALVPAE